MKIKIFIQSHIKPSIIIFLNHPKGHMRKLVMLYKINYYIYHVIIEYLDIRSKCLHSNKQIYNTTPLSLFFLKLLHSVFGKIAMNIFIRTKKNRFNRKEYIFIIYCHRSRILLNPTCTYYVIRKHIIT